MYRAMRIANTDMVITPTFDVILTTLMGIDNGACVCLALSVTAINWATVTLIMLSLYQYASMQIIHIDGLDL